MGILSALFGSKKTDTKDNDGSWLKMERNSTWKEVAKFDDTQPIEASLESCFKNQMGTFCVLRTYNKQRNIMLYMGCLIPDDQNDFILVVVDRGENPNIGVVKKDDWTRDRVLEKGKIPSVSDAIPKIHNQAAFNNYSTVPPFVFHLMINFSS
jgi:hypothetical protein